MANTRNEIIEHIPARILRLARGLSVDPIPIRQPVRLESTLLQSYVGRYRHDRLNTAEIVLSDGVLVVRPSNSDHYPIYPLSATEFFNKSSRSSSIRFLKSDDGSVTGMIYRDGEMTLKYKKADDKRR